MAVSKRLRYEVLQRDNFTCRYCGAFAPFAVLEVDHVMPHALYDLEALGAENALHFMAQACIKVMPYRPTHSEQVQLAAMLAREAATAPVGDGSRWPSLS